jgi:hypothetical protein
MVFENLQDLSINMISIVDSKKNVFVCRLLTRFFVGSCSVSSVSRIVVCVDIASKRVHNFITTSE